MNLTLVPRPERTSLFPHLHSVLIEYPDSPTVLPYDGGSRLTELEAEIFVELVSIEVFNQGPSRRISPSRKGLADSVETGPATKLPY